MNGNLFFKTFVKPDLNDFARLVEDSTFESEISGLSSELQSLLRKLLNANPDDRPSTGALLQEDLIKQHIGPTPIRSNSYNDDDVSYFFFFSSSISSRR